MDRREEELARVEERVKKLRALLTKRASKKQEIIDLQIKVLENEADGLGFFNNAQPPGAMGWSIFHQYPQYRSRWRRWGRGFYRRGRRNGTGRRCGIWARWRRH